MTKKTPRPEPDLRLDKREAATASDAIWNAFNWSASKEGGDYWKDIADRLEEMAAGAKPYTYERD